MNTRVWLAGGAVLATLALAQWSPLGRDDPFRTTLLVLPLVLLGLVEIGRWAGRCGGRRWSRRATAGETLALGLLLVLAVFRTTLGLSLADELVAAGLVLLLAHRVARLVLYLRPCLGRRLPDRPPLAFFALPVLVYVAILPWQTEHRPPDGDEPYYLLLTHSLAYDLDADLTNNYLRQDWRQFLDREIEPQPGDPHGPGGEIYSRHNQLLPMLLAPAYRLAGKTGALLTMAVLAAALAWMTLRVARHYVPSRPGEALLAWALMAFSPPLLLYSYQVWVEIPAALLTLVALDRVLQLRTGERWRPRHGVELAVSLVLLPLLKLRFVLLAVPLLALAWWNAQRRRKLLVWAALLLLLVGGAILLHNQLLYHDPLKIYSWSQLELYRVPPTAYLKGSLGLFFDAAYGLFSCAPIWMLLLPATVLLVSQRHPLLLHLTVLALPYLTAVASRREWFGGWSPPFRYGMVLLPLLALALIPLLARRRQRGAKLLLLGLVLATLIVSLLQVVVPGWAYNLADGRNHFLDHLSARIGADVARLFPSYVRPRVASWLWPPASLALLTFLWWRPRICSARLTQWSVAGLLLTAAALPWFARRLPTRVLEFEDPGIVERGGHLYPEKWVLDRTRYRGGWVLPVGHSLSAPVVPGGDRLVLTLEAQLVRNGPTPLHVEIYAGDQRVGLWRPARDRIWERSQFGPFPWSPGEPLRLQVEGLAPPGPRNGVLLDRAYFDWR